MPPEREAVDTPFKGKGSAVRYTPADLIFVPSSTPVAALDAAFVFLATGKWYSIAMAQLDIAQSLREIERELERKQEAHREKKRMLERMQPRLNEKRREAERMEQEFQALEREVTALASEITHAQTEFERLRRELEVAMKKR